MGTAGVPEVAVVVDGGAAVGDRLAQHAPYRRVKRRSLLAGEPAGPPGRADPGQVAGLVDIDVAQPGDPGLVEERRLHRPRGAPHQAVETLGCEVVGEGLDA